VLRRLLSWFRPRAAAVPDAQSTSHADKYANPFGDLLAAQRAGEQRQAEAFAQSIKAACDKIQVWQPVTQGAAMDAKDPLITLTAAMDSGDNGLPAFKAVMVEFGTQMQLMPWYMRQGFIGYQNAGFIAQHWLVYKACAVPIDDAIRNGYEVTTATGEDLDEDALALIKSADRRMGIKGQLRDFGIKGRIFGIRIALFEVESEDPEYYQKPFNLDGVKAGTYKGVSQVDPYWCAPILDITSAAVPSAKHFYEPTWWLIGSRRVHRSHLVIFRYADPADVIKPLYLFGGIPLPQMLMERVYCAERTANEAPALALSKRTTVWMTDMSKVMADSQKAQIVLQNWIANRDSFGVKLGDKESEEFQQFDTPLADFDSLVMTQYGLVAATAGCPITKLLGTTPGGFAATGEYDESSYHESEESIQERDLTPFLERHHELVMRSEVVPKFPELADVELVAKWNELDAMTHVEQSTVNLNKAQTDAALIASGSLMPEDSRARIAADKDSGYHGIGVDLELEELPDEDDPDAAAEAAGPARHVEKAAVEERQVQSNGAGAKPRRPNGALAKS
jgi:phage-related protein (TIGR01555 family)